MTARRLLELDTPRKIQIAKLPHTVHWPTPSVQAHSHKHKNFIVSTDVKADFSVWTLHAASRWYPSNTYVTLMLLGKVKVTVFISLKQSGYYRRHLP